MPPRKSPAQIQAELRRLQQRQRQAISNYNRDVDKYNRAVRKAVNDHNAGVRKSNQAIDRYNSAARAHNAKVRANRERLRREVARLNASPRTLTVRLRYRTSVEKLTTSFETLERQAESQGWADSDVLELTSAETANSVAALNALLADGTAAENSEGDVDELQSIKTEGGTGRTRRRFRPSLARCPLRPEPAQPRCCAPLLHQRTRDALGHPDEGRTNRTRPGRGPRLRAHGSGHGLAAGADSGSPDDDVGQAAA
jgi:hypothetical protein